MKIFEVAPEERLIAHGKYNYQVSGKNSGLTESWSLRRLPSGELVHRAEVGRQVAAIHLLQMSHLTLTPDYRPKRLEMTQTLDGRSAHTVVRCHPEAVEQSITSEDESDVVTFDVPPNYGLFFPPVSGHGFILKNYNLKAGGRQSLPLASLRVQPEGDLPLSADVYTIDYERVHGKQEIETPAGQFACYHFIRHDQHMQQQLWLDENWIVVQWLVPYSPIMKWEYLLTRYYREAQ